MRSQARYIHNILYNIQTHTIQNLQKSGASESDGFQRSARVVSGLPENWAFLSLSGRVQATPTLSQQVEVILPPDRLLCWDHHWGKKKARAGIAGAATWAFSCGVCQGSPIAEGLHLPLNDRLVLCHPLSVPSELCAFCSALEWWLGLE